MSGDRRKQLEAIALSQFPCERGSNMPKCDEDEMCEGCSYRGTFLFGMRVADANPQHDKVIMESTPTLSRLTDAERERLRADRKQVMEQGIDLPLFEQRNLIELVERLDGGAK
jgi:hypothetical protein